MRSGKNTVKTYKRQSINYLSDRNTEYKKIKINTYLKQNEPTYKTQTTRSHYWETNTCVRPSSTSHYTHMTPVTYVRWLSRIEWTELNYQHRTQRRCMETPELNGAVKMCNNIIFILKFPSTVHRQNSNRSLVTVTRQLLHYYRDDMHRMTGEW